MHPSALYIACVASTVALYVLLRPGKRVVRGVAGLVAMGIFAGVLGMLANAAGDSRPPIFFAVFALIAVAAAGRMITHDRPVYSALYFILVVLSSAALFLLLEAEFMAFALVIVYAGAILVTYVFVIMLAQQADDGESPEGRPEYDRVSREPAAAAAVGLLMLALLCHLFLIENEQLPAHRSTRDANAEAWHELEQMPIQLRATVAKVSGDDDFTLGWGDGGPTVVPAEDRFGAEARYLDAQSNRKSVVLTADHAPGNVQRVGWALVYRFPVSLELAGVILLLAMFGAVVLARRQIELGEDELRRSAGLGGYALDAMDDSEATDQTDHGNGGPA